MIITSATFVKGITSDDSILTDGIPQVAFIGRSNVGKSSILNALTRQKDLARTSSFPGRTQEINFFLINMSFYLVDLPGYGYAQMSGGGRDKIRTIIYTYLFHSLATQKKVVLIIDALVGPTKEDLEVLRELEEHKKDIVVIANKIDKVPKASYINHMKKIQTQIGRHKMIVYSSKKKTGDTDVLRTILK